MILLNKVVVIFIDVISLVFFELSTLKIFLLKRFRYTQRLDHHINFYFPNTMKALPLFHPCGSDDRASVN
jgi:hypothetical protein